MVLLSSVLLLFFCLWRSDSRVEAEFFSAIGEMRTLLDHQNTFVAKLDEYVQQEEQRLDLIKKYLGKVESRFGGPQVRTEMDNDDDDGNDDDDDDDGVLGKCSEYEIAFDMMLDSPTPPWFRTA